MSGTTTPRMPGGIAIPDTAIKRKEVAKARKSRRLAMLPEDIRNLIATTPKKARPPVQAEELYEEVNKSVKTLEIVIGTRLYQIKTPPITDNFITEYSFLKGVA